MKRPDVRVVSNPEFLREGSAVEDFLRPDRVVVGSEDQAAAIAVGALYDKVHAQVIVTDPASAETIKYAANAFLATKLSFINAIAAICEGVGADVNDVVVGMGYDKRIGTEFLRPGPGWGGSCFPKDSRALLKIANEAGYSFDLLTGVVAVNDEQFTRVTHKIRSRSGWIAARAHRRRVGAHLQGAHRTTCATRRRSRSSTGSSRPVRPCRPSTPPSPDKSPASPAAVEICTDPYAAAAGADVLAVLTEWDDFKWLEAEKVAGVMTGRAVVDGRNLLDRAEWQRAGFTYQGIGR
jgi:UDPglucose 6-dehydrogenase